VHNGRTYLFSNAEAKAMFDNDKNGIVTQADTKWPTLKQK
jgi:YHS domain-containing protein